MTFKACCFWVVQIKVYGLLICLLKDLIINVFKCLSNYPTSFLYISVWRLFVIFFEFNNFLHLEKKKKEVIWRTTMGVKACCFWVLQIQVVYGHLICQLKVLIINVFKCLSNYPTSFLFISVWRLFVILFEFNNFFHLKKKKREKKELIWRTIMGVKACCFWWISNHAKQSHINIFFFNPKKKKSRYNEKMIGKKPSEILCVKNSVPLAKLVFP